MEGGIHWIGTNERPHQALDMKYPAGPHRAARVAALGELEYRFTTEPSPSLIAAVFAWASARSTSVRSSLDKT
jgi:hypothetical protein